MFSQVAVGEPVGLEPGDGDGGEQGVDAGVTEAQSGDALSVETAGWVTWWKTVSPMIGSWLIVWASRRRRLAEKPTSRRAGRLHSRLPIQKSRVSLMVVSVRRARPSLWYCLIRVCLYSTCRLGVTPWVSTRVRNRPSVR